MLGVVTHPSPDFNDGSAKLTAGEVKAWVSDYIPLFWLSVITYSCTKLGGTLTATSLLMLQRLCWRNLCIILYILMLYDVNIESENNCIGSFIESESQVNEVSKMSPDNIYEYFIHIEFQVFPFLWHLNVYISFSAMLVFHVQSSAVITRSNIVRYYFGDYRNWSRTSIRCWDHKTHPIPRPNGRAMGCILWIFVRKPTAL